MKSLKMLIIGMAKNGVDAHIDDLRLAGYTKTRTHSHINGKGEMVTTRNTVWTEKGRMFIHSLFKMEVGA